MKNKLINILVMLTCLMCFTNVKAENINLNYDNNIKILADENTNNDITPVTDEDCENTLGSRLTINI